MSSSIISAGDASNLGIQTTGGDDGVLVLRAGAAGAKVDALNIAASGTGAFVGQVTATGFTGTLDGVLGGGTPAAATVTTLTSNGIDDNAAALAMTIDSSGSLGINRTNPSSIVGSTAGGFVLQDGGRAGSTTQFAVLNSSGISSFSLLQNATASFSGSVGIGTASPAAKLSVVGEVTATGFTGTLDGVLGGGTPAAATVTTFTSNGIDDNADAVAITIDSSENVGIGTTTVASNFRQEIVGLAGSNDGPASSGTTQSTSAVMRIRPGGNFTGTLDIGQAGGTSSWIQSTDTGNLATTYPLLLNPIGGNVGIGTPSPAYKLDVSGTGRFTDSLRILTGATTTSGLIVGGDATAGNTWTIARDNVSTGDLKFISGTAERIRITAAGNVGIGTAAPSTPLHVNGAITVGQINAASGTKIYTVGSGTYELDIAGELTLSSGRDNGASMLFEVSNSEKMRLDAGGKVGIGTQSPTDRLQLNISSTSTNPVFGGTTDQGIRLKNSNATAGNFTSILNVNSANTLSSMIAFRNVDHSTPNTAGAIDFVTRNGGTLYRAMTIAETGNLELNHSLVYKGAPASIYNADVFPNSIAVANNGTVNFPSFSGYLLICSHTTGHTGIFIAGGGSTLEVGTIGGGGVNGSFLGNAAIGGYTYTNTYGSSQTVGFYCVRGRNTR